MRTFVTPASIALSLALGASITTAQDSRPHYRRSAEATVDIIDVPTRIVELKRSEGYYVRLHVPETFNNFESLKVGQTVKATYNENVILSIQKSGGKEHKREPVAPPKSTADAHGNPDLVRKVTATVTAIDPKFGNVSFTDPANGRLYFARVDNSDVSKMVKVGDKVDITYTQATLVELK